MTLQPPELPLQLAFPLLSQSLCPSVVFPHLASLQQPPVATPNATGAEPQTTLELATHHWLALSFWQPPYPHFLTHSFLPLVCLFLLFRWSLPLIVICGLPLDPSLATVLPCCLSLYHSGFYCCCYRHKLSFPATHKQL